MREEEIFEEMEKAQEKVENLKDQRNKLIEANKALLQLVEKMESEIDLESSEHEYSFKEGWKNEEVLEGLRLNPQEYSEEELERQVDQVIKTVNRLENI